MYSKGVTTNGIIFLADTGVPSLPVVLLFGKMNGERGREWSRAETQLETVQKVWGGRGREGEQGLLEKVTGSAGARGINQSSVPSGNGAPLHWAPPCQAKHHTSSPFCGCGGRASWRTPCPGAVGEKKKKKEEDS